MGRRRARPSAFSHTHTQRPGPRIAWRGPPRWWEGGKGRGSAAPLGRCQTCEMEPQRRVGCQNRETHKRGMGRGRSDKRGAEWAARKAAHAAWEGGGLVLKETVASNQRMHAADEMRQQNEIERQSRETPCGWASRPRRARRHQRRCAAAPAAGASQSARLSRRLSRSRRRRRPSSFASAPRAPASRGSARRRPLSSSSAAAPPARARTCRRRRRPRGCR